MTRATPRRPNSRSAPRRCPVRCVSAVAAAVVPGRAGRRWRGLLPLPADDARQSSLLTTSLRAGEPIDDDVAVVVSTSGTTGVPKGAMLTASTLTASAEATHRRLGGPGRWLLALPAYHVAGLQVLVRSVVAGTTPVAISAGFDAAELASAVTSLGSGRRYASLVAAQLDKALGDPSATAALASLDAVLIGGGPMPTAIAERASTAGISVVRTYGMSETAGAVCTTALPWTGCGSIDDGRVVLGGATLAKGYRNPVEPDPFAEPGWFRTDDVGAVDDSDVLRVLGRVDDAISTGGLTVFPQLVEAALATHPSVADCRGVRSGRRTTGTASGRGGRRRHRTPGTNVDRAARARRFSVVVDGGAARPTSRR